MIVHSTTGKTVLMGTVTSVVSEFAACKALFFGTSFGFFFGTVVAVGNGGVHVELLKVAHVALIIVAVRREIKWTR